MTKPVDYKYFITAASLGAGAVLALGKAKGIVLENYLLREQLRQQSQFIAEEEDAKRQIAAHFANQMQLPEKSESFGFARALSDS